MGVYDVVFNQELSYLSDSGLEFPTSAVQELSLASVSGTRNNSTILLGWPESVSSFDWGELRFGTTTSSTMPTGGRSFVVLSGLADIGCASTPQPQVVHPYMVGARVTADPKAKPKRKRSQAIVGIAKNVSGNSFPKKPRPKRRRAKRSAASVEAN